MTADPFDGLERLGEVIAGVDEDHFDRRLDSDSQVDEDCIGHRRRQTHERMKLLYGPFDDGLGGSRVEGPVERGQLRVAELGACRWIPVLSRVVMVSCRRSFGR